MFECDTLSRKEGGVGVAYRYPLLSQGLTQLVLFFINGIYRWSVDHV